MRKLLFILVLFVFGCGTVVSEVRPVVAENRRPEARELPVDPDHESIPEGYDTTLGEDHVEPMEEGSCIPAHGITVPASDDDQVIPGPCPTWGGIAISETRAARDAMYRIRYRELRRTFEADRRVWSAHRELYESQVAEDRREIEHLQPTWWDRHGLAVGVAGGFILGAATAILITYAIEQVTE